MKSINRFIVAGICAFSMSAVAADMQELFDSYSQGATGTYNTSNGRYFYGGSFTGRVKQTDVDFLRFSPPSVGGGCSGIDIFAGSFGMVSGDELVQVARGVAQGAAPYFFNIALNSICPACAAVSKDISNTIEKMNKFGKNACENAWGALDETTGFSNAIGDMANSAGLGKDAYKGNISSWFDGLLDEEDGGSKVSDSTRQEIFDQNLVALAISASYSNFTLPNLGYNDTRSTVEFIQSVFGTVIHKALVGGSCTANEAAGKDCVESTPIEPSLSLDTLLYGIQPGTTEGSMFRECGAGSNYVEACLDIRAESNLPGSFEGLYEKYKRIMLGDASGPTEDGVIGKLRRKEDLTAEQEKLTLLADQNYLKIAKDVKGMAANEVADMVILKMAHQQIEDVALDILTKMKLTAVTESNYYDGKLVDAAYMNKLAGEFRAQIEHLRQKVNEDINSKVKVTSALASYMALNKE
ncbi:conjugal transfer protein TraH [Alteromonas gilva]|uniref:Conjugal transfer protein TraH n=1 Tax=Alteromonas gilva TaxID=2987522 RepID=A0ABT5L753_9ALTE|nr:conjugal transfer protein TraH [Alteromonas gilva]MDC8832861.1 conjugal transfer protein TraH [Alteromonas gilva]